MSALLVGDHGDAEILLAFEEVDFPSERCAHASRSPLTTGRRSW